VFWPDCILYGACFGLRNADEGRRGDGRRGDGRHGDGGGTWHSEPSAWQNQLRQNRIRHPKPLIANPKSHIKHPTSHIRHCASDIEHPTFPILTSFPTPLSFQAFSLPGNYLYRRNVLLPVYCQTQTLCRPAHPENPCRAKPI